MFIFSIYSINRGGTINTKHQTMKGGKMMTTGSNELVQRDKQISNDMQI